MAAVKKTMLSWSSGKDSTWALMELKRREDIDLVGLFTTVNEKFERVAMHAVRNTLLKEQAKTLGLPLKIIDLPFPCSNEDYEERMKKFVDEIKEQGVEAVAFGDLFLEDVRKYREDKMHDTGIETIFPIWGLDTKQLAHEMVRSGVKAKLTCVDPKQLDKSFVGRDFDDALLRDLPDGVDPCGENGEFHSFVYEAPIFERPLRVKVGEIVERDGFVFADVLPEDE